MGIGVSNWVLARAVSLKGQLGVVSGTGVAIVAARRLLDGDAGGHMRRALDAFPVREVARRVKEKYFQPLGRALGKAYKAVPNLSLQPGRDITELTVCANFAEVWLAKEGHEGLVGINYLEKIQLAHLASPYGAMLAGVDFVLMGAGIPTQIPGILDRLADHNPVAYRLSVEGAQSGEEYKTTFTPRSVNPQPAGPLKRPRFLPIVSSATLAQMLVNKASGTVNGFIVEGPTAGGHNAPPRGALQLNAKGEPLYGRRDEADLERFRELGLPFWLAGGYASPAGLKSALAEGAAGIQAGSIFALCEESGLAAEYKARLRKEAWNGRLEVFTDPYASPSGFPFKVAVLPGTLSQREEYEARHRVCDLGYLRKAYRKPDGTIGLRCTAEPVHHYEAKGGKPEDTEGSKCLCNALMADIGLAQVRKDGYVEKPLITLGDDVSFVRNLMDSEDDTYRAADAVDYLLRDVGDA